MKNEIVFTLSSLVFLHLKFSKSYRIIIKQEKLGQLNVIPDMFLEYDVRK